MTTDARTPGTATNATPAIDRPSTPVSRNLALLVGGLVIVAALARLLFLALHPPIDHHLYDYDAMADIRTTWWVTHLYLAGPGFPVAFAGLGALIVALCVRAGRGVVPAVVGALTAGTGGLLAGLGFAAEAATWAYLTNPDVVSRAAGARAFASMEEHPGLIDTPILAGFALIALGVIVLLAGLWRSGLVPVWVPIAGIVLALSSQAPFPPALRAVPGVLDTTLLIGLTVLAVRRLRR